MASINEILDEREKDPKEIKKNKSDIEKLHNMQVGDVCVISHPSDDALDKLSRTGDVDLAKEMRDKMSETIDDAQEIIDDEKTSRGVKTQMLMAKTALSGLNAVTTGVLNVGMAAMRRQGISRSQFVDETCVCVGRTEDGVLFVPLQDEHSIPPRGYNGHMYGMMLLSESEIPRYNIDIDTTLNKKQQELVDNSNLTAIVEKYTTKIDAERKHNANQPIVVSTFFKSEKSHVDKKYDLDIAQKALLKNASAMKDELCDALGVSPEDEDKVKLRIFVDKPKSTGWSFEGEFPQHISVTIEGLDHGDIYSDNFSFIQHSHMLEKIVEETLKDTHTMRVCARDRHVVAGYDGVDAYEVFHGESHIDYLEQNAVEISPARQVDIPKPILQTPYILKPVDTINASEKSKVEEVKLNESLLPSDYSDDDDTPRYVPDSSLDIF